MRLRTVLTGLSAAAVLLLPACGGDEDTTSAPAGSAAGSAAETSAPAEQDGEFCDQAATALESVNSAVATAQSDPTQLSAALQSAADQLGAITPPDEIAADWATVVDGASQLAASTQGVDITTPEGQAQVSAELSELSATVDPASQNVQTYLSDTCGITDSEPTATS